MSINSSGVQFRFGDLGRGGSRKNEQQVQEAIWIQGTWSFQGVSKGTKGWRGGQRPGCPNDILSIFVFIQRVEEFSDEFKEYDMFWYLSAGQTVSWRGPEWKQRQSGECSETLVTISPTFSHTDGLELGALILPVSW
jgi:hypothetical protein